MSCSVVTVETPELGDRSYMVHDGDVAVVVDPQRDIDRVLAVADAAGVTITHVAETHLHNDYVSGGLELSRVTGASYLVAATEQVDFPRQAVNDGDTIAAGRMELLAVATPGHTPGHLAYVVHCDGRADSVFTGGSLLHGTVGRTDLIDPGRTYELAAAQYRSVRRLAASLDDDVALHPTHGFGSFCASTNRSAFSRSTIGEERAGNPALVTTSEREFVESLVAGFVAYPTYYARMAAVNASGPPPIDLSPPAPVDAGELARRLRAGEWVVDLRDRVTFARSHLAGSVSIEHADSFATYTGWVLPWEAPITLVSDSPERIERARRDLARIGLDRLGGAASGPLETLAGHAPRSSFGVSTFAGLAKEIANGNPVVLDVRRNDEWKRGHVEGARHLFVAETAEHLDEVPAGEVWVYCASGYRASIAASMLQRAGREVVLVDDDWSNALWAGLTIVPG